MTYSLSSMYAIQKTRLRCSTSALLRLKLVPFLCSPMLWASLMAVAMKKYVGCGFGVPNRNRPYMCQLCQRARDRCSLQRPKELEH
jgi:hypothetical protein